jgi:glycosyltransferase involved in cell wall biosynthesis
MKLLRILHTVSSWRWTGAAEPTAYIALNQLRQGHEVQLACIGGSSLEENAHELGLDVITQLDFKARLNPFAHINQILKMRDYLRRERIDVVHTHLAHDHWVAGLAIPILAKHDPRPILARTAHREELRIDPLHTWLFKKRTDLIFAVSKEQRRQICDKWQLDEERVPLLYGAIDLKRFRLGLDGSHLRKEWKVPNGAPLVGMIGRMRPGRGHLWVLKTAPEVMKEIPDARFVLCGRGGLKSDVRNRISELGDKVHALAPGYLPQEELAASYHAFDITLVLGIGSDKTCRGLLQAMASGRPIIAMRKGVIADIIKDGYNGLLVDRDDVEGLANAIIDLIKNPDKAASLGIAARQTAEEHFREDQRAVAITSAYQSSLQLRRNM